ncbi:MAG: hypothetical protein KKE20_02890 [Nanoarchaeota archaeon]|nr:hypothetical protein [Nanoarchaeota archaeon]
MALERLVHKLDTEQRTGIFRVPDEIKADYGIKIWTGRKRRDDIPAPIVVEEEEYYRTGARKKIGAHIEFLNKLCKAGMIRPRDGEDFDYLDIHIVEPVSTLSLAQTISWAFHRPIEDVLVSNKDFKSREFRSMPEEEQISYLFHAYQGAHWFERFLGRQKSITEGLNSPVVRSWQKISRMELSEWFMADSMYLVKQLIDKGLLIPENKIKTHSKVDVNNVGLARLLSLIHNVPFDQVYLDGNDPYCADVADDFLSKKLMPYMLSYSIHPDSRYSIKESVRIIHLPYRRLFEAVKSGALKNTRYQKDGKTSISGIDLAIYALRNSDKLSYTLNEVNDLFGVSVEPRRLGMRMTDKGTYSRHHYVLPAYDYIADKTRSRVMGSVDDGFINFFVGGKEFQMTIGAVHDYCIEYGLVSFDDRSIAHLGQQFAEAELKKATIVTPDLRMRIEGDRIVGIGIKENSIRY